jgi:hypothetical protein
MLDKDLKAEADKLRPKAMFDHRHPIMYEESISMGVAVLVRFFAALQRRDLYGMAEQLHFPHAAIEETDVVIIGSPEELLANPPRSMDVRALPEGSFDLLTGIETHTSDPVRAGLTLAYSRHGADGAKRAACEGVYVVTLNDGRWGVHMSSTIFTPVEHIGTEYPEAVQSVFECGHDWMEGWSRSDAELLDSHRRLLGRSIAILPNITGLGREPVDLFRSEGVESRLRITDTAEIRPGTYNFEHFRQNVAGHGVGGYSHTLFRSDARVIHQSRNKVHVAGGYTRFQADNTPISTTWSLGVHVRRNLEWGSVGGTGNTIHYDATNNA